MKEKYFSINEAGSSIRCKLYYNDLKAVSRAVICVHGFGGHKDNKAAQRFAEHLLKKHKNAVAVTYDAPCHGDDVKKTLTLGDCDVYLREVIRHVTEHFTPEKCNAYATSFGGYQILKYIAEHGNPFGKIGLRCPAVRMYDVLSQRIISPDEQRMLMKNKPVAVGFDRKIKITRQFLDELKTADITSWDFRPFADDILILHGTKDEIVPIESTEDFADRNDILFLTVEGADHRFIDPLKMDAAVNDIIEFME